eukprot:477552-Alexandrium_andersonii.AAC.1
MMRTCTCTHTLAVCASVLRCGQIEKAALACACAVKAWVRERGALHVYMLAPKLQNCVKCTQTHMFFENDRQTLIFKSPAAGLL